MRHKNIILTTVLAYILMVHTAGGASMDVSKLENTTIPMVFSEGMEYQKYSLLPPKVVLTPQKLFAEGFVRYKLKVKIKGDFQYKEKKDDSIRPVWLFSASDDEIEGLMHYHPMSKSDLLAIIKHSNISRSQLIDILRRWDDEVEQE